MRFALMSLYAEALDQGSEGGARFIAYAFSDRYDEDIEDAMVSEGWVLHVVRGSRRFERKDALSLSM